jgi:hypothetical protein
MTSDRQYYEAPYPLSADHQEVELRPEGDFFFHDGRWLPERRFQRTPEELVQIFNQNRLGSQMAPPIHQYDQQQMQPQQPHPQVQMPQQQIPGMNAPYQINQDSQFQFKLKDVIIIAGAIASAAVSWNNADGRISRLEEKVTQDMVKKIESIEKKQDEAIRRQEDSVRSLAAQITDLERVITNMARSAPQPVPPRK